MRQGNVNPKGSWKNAVERDKNLKGIKPYAKRHTRLTDESRQEAMELLGNMITEDRDIAYFAEIFNSKPLKDKCITSILALNRATLTTQKWLAKKNGKSLNIRTKFCYRALKHLKPEIIYFLLNDKYFDENFELKREFKEAFDSVREVREMDIKED